MSEPLLQVLRAPDGSPAAATGLDCSHGDAVLFEAAHPGSNHNEISRIHRRGQPDDPATSVVDANSRVHGMENLYVAGSSVFATAGQCTPTTTITALSLRLGDHLGRTVAS